MKAVRLPPGRGGGGSGGDDDGFVVVVVVVVRVCVGGKGMVEVFVLYLY